MNTPSRAPLLIIFLTVFIDLIGFGMVLPLLPIYARQFALSETGLTIGLLMASFSAMQFVVAPLWGRLSDHIGRRPVILIGLAGSVAFYLLFAVATVMQSLALLFVSRIGAGVAGATISTAQAYIADSTKLENRARGMALVGAAFGLGFTIGPILAIFALSGDSDVPGPGPGYAASGISLVALLLAWRMLPESLRPGSAPARAHWLDPTGMRAMLGTPSVTALVFTSFICTFSLANFESTLSLMLADAAGQFDLTLRQVCLVFAYIGLVLTVVQGGIVRRLAHRVPELGMASFGLLTQVAGYGMLIVAAEGGSPTWLLVSLGVVVSGFAFVTPSVHSLISRRSDPQRQGSILGVVQSTGALARIIGPVVGVWLFYRHVAAPYWVAASLVVMALAMLVLAAGRGRDWPHAPDEQKEAEALADEAAPLPPQA